MKGNPTSLSSDSDGSISYYRDSFEHVTDLLLKLDLLIHIQVQQLRARNASTGENTFAGLAVGDDEVDRLMDTPYEQPNPIPDGTAQQPGTAEQKLHALNRRIGEFVEKSVENEIWLSFYQMAQAFHLNQFEMDIILICLAPELDTKYERLFAYLHEDITRKAPTVELILKLLCRSARERIDAWTYFLPHASLIKYQLLSVTEPTAPLPLPSRQLKLDDRVAAFLTGHFTPVPLLGFDSAVRFIRPARDWDSLIFQDDFEEKINRLAHTFFPEPGGSLVFYFQGPAGTGKKSAAEAFCRQHHLLLYILDIEILFRHNRSGEAENLLKRLLREPFFVPATIFIQHFDTLFSGASDSAHAQPLITILSNVAREQHIILFLSGTKPWDPSIRLKAGLFHAFQFNIPSQNARKQIWIERLRERMNNLPVDPEVVETVSGHFSFSGGQIRDAAGTAVNFALLHSGENGPVLSADDLQRACRYHCSSKLAQLAQKITPRYRWSDIVLPPDNMEHLREIVNYVHFRHVVYDRWGFDRKLSLGKGLNVLFSGPSGTGKTMAAEIIANQLGLDLYKIDLSGVVSKYIGETEKNLSAVFDEARTANAVLFFDEADALFGKRSEVKDAHDRYANIETNYLLQKIEEHMGIVVLATNFRKNIDDAFTRRMHFCLEFPFPDEEYRRMIWEKSFPSETPCEKHIDYDFLAHRLRITGGSIKNIVLGAAFLAAAASEPVGMKHIIPAMQREYRKTGNICDPSEFGRYRQFCYPRNAVGSGGEDE